MKIYWTIGSIPELKGLPKSEVKKIWRESCMRSFATRKFWLGLIILALFALIGLGTLLYLMATFGNGNFNHILSIIITLMVIGVGGNISSLFWTNAVRQIIRMRLDKERRSE